MSVFLLIGLSGVLGPQAPAISMLRCTIIKVETAAGLVSFGQTDSAWQLLSCLRSVYNYVGNLSSICKMRAFNASTYR